MRIWHAFGLQPHRVENLKFSKDLQFVEKVRDIVGLCLNPPDRAIVLCVHKKSQVQVLNRTKPILVLAPGVPARQSHDYQRHGVTSLLAAMDAASGVTISTCYRRHRHHEFLRFLNEVEGNLPAGMDVHLVMDNYGTHKVVKGSRTAGAASALSRSLHTQRKLPQSCRAAVRRSDRALSPSRKPHQRRHARESQARLLGPPQPQTQALHMGGQCGRDTRQGRTSL